MPTPPHRLVEEAAERTAGREAPSRAVAALPPRPADLELLRQDAAEADRVLPLEHVADARVGQVARDERVDDPRHARTLVESAPRPVARDRRSARIGGAVGVWRDRLLDRR